MSSGASSLPAVWVSSWPCLACGRQVSISYWEELVTGFSPREDSGMQHQKCMQSGCLQTWAVSCVLGRGESKWCLEQLLGKALAVLRVPRGSLPTACWEEWFCYKGRREPRMCPLFRPDKQRGQVLEASLMPSVTSSS